jgi:ribonuclease PH
MRLLQQLLAATLNAQLFGSTPIGLTIDQAKAAYCGTNVATIKAAHAAMAAFNSAGDAAAFTPGSSGNPRDARAVADLALWDKLP